MPEQKLQPALVLGGRGESAARGGSRVGPIVVIVLALLGEHRLRGPLGAVAACETHGGGQDPVARGSIESVTDTTKDLLKRALELAPTEREHLARELLASLEDADDVEVEPDPAFVADLRGRVDRALSGTSDPGDDFRVVLERLRRRHEDRHKAS